VFVYKVSVWFRMSEFKACEILIVRSPEKFGMTAIKNERNAEIGHYGQTLFRKHNTKLN